MFIWSFRHILFAHTNIHILLTVNEPQLNGGKHFSTAEQAWMNVSNVKLTNTHTHMLSAYRIGIHIAVYATSKSKLNNDYYYYNRAQCPREWCFCCTHNMLENGWWLRLFVCFMYYSLWICRHRVDFHFFLMCQSTWVAYME